jgi:hypothetical protein
VKNKETNRENQTTYPKKKKKKGRSEEKISETSNHQYDF